MKCKRTKNGSKEDYKRDLRNKLVNNTKASGAVCCYHPLCGKALVDNLLSASANTTVDKEVVFEPVINAQSTHVDNVKC
ncbi:hypothetical protein CBL_03000 [Carabus blaptoides fortunei]